MDVFQMTTGAVLRLIVAKLVWVFGELVDQTRDPLLPLLG